MPIQPNSKLKATTSWPMAARYVRAQKNDGALIDLTFSPAALAWLEAVAIRQLARTRAKIVKPASGYVRYKNPRTAARNATENVMAELLCGLPTYWRKHPGAQLFRRELTAAAAAYCAHFRRVGSLQIFLNIFAGIERGFERSVYTFHRDWWQQKYTDLQLVQKPTRLICPLIGNGTEIITAQNSCRIPVAALPFAVGGEARFYTVRNPQHIYTLPPQTALVMPIDNAGPIHRAPRSRTLRVLLKMQNLIQ